MAEQPIPEQPIAEEQRDAQEKVPGAEELGDEEEPGDEEEQRDAQEKEPGAEEEPMAEEQKLQEFKSLAVGEPTTPDGGRFGNVDASSEFRGGPETPNSAMGPEKVSSDEKKRYTDEELREGGKVEGDEDEDEDEDEGEDEGEDDSELLGIVIESEISKVEEEWKIRENEIKGELEKLRLVIK